MKYSFWRFGYEILSINSIRKFCLLNISFTCLILQRQLSTQSQDDCEEDSFDSFDSFEEPSSIKRSWSSLDDSIEVWLGDSDYDSVLIKLIICCLRCFPTSKFAIISLTLQFGAICSFFPHLKHSISFLLVFFE